MLSFSQPNEYMYLTPPKPKNGGALPKKELPSLLSLLTTKDGQFKVKWARDERTYENKLPEYDFPLLTKTLFQSLGFKSGVYNETFWFDGSDARDELDRFEKLFETGDADGVWEINHPTKGILKLTPVKITVLDNPVDSMLYYEVNSTWVAGLDEFKLLAADGAQDAIKKASGQSFNFSDANFNQLANDVRGFLKKVERVVKDTLEFTNTIKNEISKAINFVQSAITAGTITATSIAESIKSIIKLPGQLITSFSTQINSSIEQIQTSWNGISGVAESEQVELAALSQAAASDIATAATISNNFYTELMTESIITRNAGNILDVANPDMSNMVSLVLNQSVLSVADTMINTTYNSRASVLQAMNDLLVLQEIYQNYNDSMISAHSINKIENKFSADLLTYELTNSAVLAVIQKLFQTLYSLKAERSIILTRPRVPLEIVLTEYGTLGDNLSVYDSFIRMNELTPDEITLLPAGREVKIYA